MTEVLSADTALRELVSIARQQLRWQQAATLPAIRLALEAALPSTEMRKVYEACNGRQTFREIAEATGVPVPTVGRWTQGWRDVALLFESETGRMEHLTSLVSVGLAVTVNGESNTRRPKKS